jgi:hypothetical protein
MQRGTGINMHFAHAFEIPYNTPVTSLYKETFKLDYGVITRVEIFSPKGALDYKHMRIYFHGAQLYPANRDGWYEVSGALISFNDRFPVLYNPYEIELQGYNTSTQYDHKFNVFIEVTRPEDLYASGVPDYIKERYYELIGREVEI